MNRSSDSVLSVYSDARAEYTKQLCFFLVPAYFQFFIDLLDKGKRESEPKKSLWQFQTYLNEIHDWNMEKVHNEINSIHTRTLAKLGLTMGDMKDCKKNIDFAYNHIYKGAGLSAWSAYNNGSYLAFLNNLN